MRATEMHDLLTSALDYLKSQEVYQFGTTPGFQHIRYCRFCSYSETHVMEHGHADDCLYGRLWKACSVSNGEG